MAKQPSQTEPTTEDDILADFAPSVDADSDVTPDAGLDGAIDDLRGVLTNDAEGTLPDLGESTDFDFDASAEAPTEEPDLSQFGGDFGSEFDAGGEPNDLGGSFGGDFDGDTFENGGMKATLDGKPVPAGSALEANLDLIMDIPIDVQIVLGNSHMHVATLMNLAEGATIALDRKIGEPVEVIVNGRLIGRGEITVLEEDNTRFGVRMIELNAVRRKQD